MTHINYHYIYKNITLTLNHPQLSNLFPRENLIGGTRQQPNLSEILSPTVQPSSSDRHIGGQGGGGGDVSGGG